MVSRSGKGLSVMRAQQGGQHGRTAERWGPIWERRRAFAAARRGVSGSIGFSDDTSGAKSPDGPAIENDPGELPLLEVDELARSMNGARDDDAPGTVGSSRRNENGFPFSARLGRPSREDEARFRSEPVAAERCSLTLCAIFSAALIDVDVG